MKFHFRSGSRLHCLSSSNCHNAFFFFLVHNIFSHAHHSWYVFSVFYSILSFIVKKKNHSSKNSGSLSIFRVGQHFRGTRSDDNGFVRRISKIVGTSSRNFCRSSSDIYIHMRSADYHLRKLNFFLHLITLKIWERKSKLLYKMISYSLPSVRNIDCPFLSCRHLMFVHDSYEFITKQQYRFVYNVSTSGPLTELPMKFPHFCWVE